MRGEAKKRRAKKHKAEERGDEARVNPREDGEAGEQQDGAGEPGPDEMRRSPDRYEAEIADETGVEEMLDAENDQGECNEDAAEPRECGAGGIAMRKVGEQKEAGVRGGLENTATPARRLVIG
jgi:hypothetical protein